MDRLVSVLRFCKSARVRPPRYSEKVRVSKVKASRKHEINHPERTVARNRARFSLKAMPCEVCGTTEKVERHHHDYSKPLEITFLCRAHHHELHSWDSN